MPANYVLLEKIVVGAAGASSVTFSGIPQTGYTDLVLKGSTRDSTSGGGASSVKVQFNASALNFTSRWIYGDGSAVGSATSQPRLVGIAPGTSYTANTFGTFDFYIPNYTSSNYKSGSSDNVAENNATATNMGFNAILWSDTSAITSITLTTDANFVQYSTFYLYGVAKLGTTPAISPYATGGDTIMTDGTYWYHAFKSSGTFTPAKGLSCDVLVVAGGGSGGADVSGGGGAGGVIAFASQSLASGTGYTCTIGAGGAGLSAKRQEGNSGSNSQFAALTAAIGGGRGTATLNADGGSGGGTRASGGSATAGQGNNGGGGSNSAPYYPAGGGGGAGGVGQTGSGSTGGNGGAGTNSVTNWGSLSAALTATGLGVSGYIAGGGGAGGGGSYATAGAAGSGGATAGSNSASSNATANTGSGSGGCTDTGGVTGNGGSGLVIVRYAV